MNAPVEPTQVTVTDSDVAIETEAELENLWGALAAGYPLRAEKVSDGGVWNIDLPPDWTATLDEVGYLAIENGTLYLEAEMP